MTENVPRANFAVGEPSVSSGEAVSCSRRAEVGHHHHIAGAYLVRYALESAWREDHRRMDNGRQVKAVARLAMHAAVSVDWSGYWQRARKAARNAKGAMAAPRDI
jgi:hypothetical protein